MRAGLSCWKVERSSSKGSTKICSPRADGTGRSSTDSNSRTQSRTKTRGAPWHSLSRTVERTHDASRSENASSVGADCRRARWGVGAAASHGAEEAADLRARDQLKTQFLANISHDLRTPLTAVITHAEILRDGLLGPVTDRQMESINGIISGGRQLLAQVGEILTYAKGAANQLTLVPVSFAIADVLEQVHALNESLIKRKHLEFQIDVESSTPPIVADREKVTHVIGNLFGNAIDFTPTGGRVWLKAVARRQGDVSE